MSHCNSPGTHVANDHMFILQGYEGSLLKVTNKNGKNTSVSTHHSPIRYRASCHPLIICVGSLSQRFGLVHVCAEGVIRIQFLLTNQNVIHDILHINLHVLVYQRILSILWQSWSLVNLWERKCTKFIYCVIWLDCILVSWSCKKFIL